MTGRWQLASRAVRRFLYFGSLRATHHGSTCCHSGDNFHSRPYAGFCRREFGKHVNDRTVTVESKADRIGHTQTGPNFFGSPLRFRRLLDIRQTITARLHSTERGAIGSRSIQPRLEKALPVIKSDTVERFNEVLKSVWLHLRRAAGRSVKQPAKIVE